MCQERTHWLAPTLWEMLLLATLHQAGRHSGNFVSGMNAWAIDVMRYSREIINWKKRGTSGTWTRQIER